MKKIILFLIKYLITISAISYLSIFIWIASAKHNNSTLIPADAIIVLGAAAWGNLPSPVFRNRIDYSITLYQKKLAKYIIFTGGTRDKKYPAEGTVAANWAMQKNIPRKAVLIDNTSRNTYENLLYAKKIAAQHQINSFIIISDAYHLNRAKVISLLLDMRVKTAATPYSNFKSNDWKTKFLTYVKETNSIYATILYHYIGHVLIGLKISSITK